MTMRERNEPAAPDHCRECGQTLTRHEPLRMNECTCCGRYMAEFWVCDDCTVEAV